MLEVFEQMEKRVITHTGTGGVDESMLLAQWQRASSQS